MGWKSNRVDDALSVDSVESNDSSVREDAPAASVCAVSLEPEDGISEASSVLTDTPGDMEWTSPMEDQQMQKARTIYIYKKKHLLQQAIDEGAVLSGIVVKRKDGKPELRVVFKGPNYSYGWKRLLFDDAEGVRHCGLWFAPVQSEDLPTNAPSTEVKIKELAKMAAVVIPLHYVAGRDHADGSKRCVLTNWWRERNHKGSYELPTLDFDLHK